MQRAVKKSKSSKYFDKCLSLWENRYRKPECAPEPVVSFKHSTASSPSTPSYHSIEHISDISTDDSGINLSAPPRIPEKSLITTTAVIEQVRHSTPNSQEVCSNREGVKKLKHSRVNSTTLWNITSPEISQGYYTCNTSPQLPKSYCDRRNENTKESNGVFLSLSIKPEEKSNFENDILAVDAIEESENIERCVNQKFVVNLFESRKSNRWKRKSVCLDNNIQVIDNETKRLSQNNVPDVDKNDKQSESDSNVMFYKLRKMRDVECVKMKEASNALRVIKTKFDKDYSEELLAERILLETDLKYKLIVKEIRDLNNTDVKPRNSKHCATLTLSNIQYRLKSQLTKSNKYSEFFILTISHGTELLMSKITTTTGDDKLIFADTFTLNDLDENFNVKVEVFCIKFRTMKHKMISSLLREKTNSFCPMSRIYYENVNTLEMQQSEIVNSSFATCGEFIITKKQMNDTSFLITQLPSSSRVENNVKVTMDVDLQLMSSLSGFLTLGRLSEQKEVIYWDRKWCSLHDNILNIYNYPQEQENEKPPIATINLEYCFVPLVKQPKNCPREKTFVLKTGRPSTINESNSTALRRKNNFVLEKYFLAADNKEEYQKWTSELDSVLDYLTIWGRLVFVDDYYL